MEIEYSADEKGARLAKIKLSEKNTVTIKELGGGDFRIVRRLTGNDAQLIADNLALFSLVEVNGEKLVPVANDMHLQSRANKFTLKEYRDLGNSYDEAFDPLGAGDAKNA